MDGETGGSGEFSVMDLVSVTDEKFVIIIEAKRASLGQGMKQCLLATKDGWDNNGGGVIYGFVTTGDHWRMIRYDGTVNSRYKHTVGARGDMLIANICLYREKITPCYIYGGATRGMLITNIYLYRVCL